MDKLRNEGLREQYEMRIGGKFDALIDMEDMDMDSEESWAILKSDTMDVATDVIGYKRRSNKPWFSDDAKALSEEQQRLRVRMEDERDLQKKRQLQQHRIEY